MALSQTASHFFCFSLLFQPNRILFRGSDGVFLCYLCFAESWAGRIKIKDFLKFLFHLWPFFTDISYVCCLCYTSQGSPDFTLNRTNERDREKKHLACCVCIVSRVYYVVSNFKLKSSQIISWLLI